MKLGNAGKLACMALALSIGFESRGVAQSRRPSGVGSLLEMKCYGKGDGNGVYVRNYDDLIVNRRTYSVVGGFASDFAWDKLQGVKKGQTVEVTCDLAGRNRVPNYKNLTMTVAMHDNSISWKGRYAARVRLTSYLDGQYAGSEEIGFSELKRFSLDISGVRNVAFSVECFNPSEDNTCPNLWILEDKLY